MLLLQPPAAAVPVLLHTDLVRVDAEAGQWVQFAKAAFELAETRLAGQVDDVVPQPARVDLGG